MKSSVAFASLAFVLAFAPAHAQTAAMKAECTQAEMTKMESDTAKMTNAATKSNALKEMTMAKEMMAKKDMTGCMTHMDNAMKMMNGK